MTYCYKCLVCGQRWEGNAGTYDCYEIGADHVVRRDYRTEAAGFSGVSQLRKEREGNGREALRDLFLPTADDMSSPDDPDGSKGLNDWNERHVPAESNKQPIRPKSSKRVF